MIYRQLMDLDSSTWTYLLADPNTGEAVLIDSVFEQHGRDSALLRELGLRLLLTLDTHCHADHVSGAWLHRQTSGCSIGLSGLYGAANVDRPLEHGDEVRFGDHVLQVRGTPGHTAGCLTYVLDGGLMAFTGDALLIRGAGRTDFQQGDASVLYRSIHEQIFSLPDSCRVCPGHDYRGRTWSTVGEEKQHNQRVGGLARERDFVGYMNNMMLPHPRKLDIALPANMCCGEPANGEVPGVVQWGPVTVSYAGTQEIEPAWVAEHRDAVVILDVRDPDEMTGRVPTLPDAIHIPLGELRGRIKEVPTDRPVVTLCPAGRRSAMAAAILRKSGLTDVANIRGGIFHWIREGLPTA